MVVLLRLGRRPWVEYAALVEERGSTAAVLEDELQGDKEQTALFSTSTPTDTTNPDTLLDQARADVERWSAQGMHLLTVLDPAYPPNLRAVHDRPPMVFVKGRLTPEDAKCVAVVGARNATVTGVKQARAIAGHLVDSGYTVVSGLAAGIDTAAHTAALTAGGRTVAVIGTGIDRSYPPQNADLQERLATQGLVISQFLPGSPPTKASFPMRNAVMSGYALATVVVEVGDRSGSRVQARLALQHGRHVFLMHSLLEHAWARDYAERPGVTVVETADDVFAGLQRLASESIDLVWA